MVLFPESKPKALVFASADLHMQVRLCARPHLRACARKCARVCVCDRARTWLGEATLVVLRHDNSQK